MKKMKRQSIESLCGKKIAISGSTGGIGRALCSHFASLGASLVLVDRNKPRSLEHMRALKERYPNIEVSNIISDMEDIDSVENAAQGLLSVDIDFLVLNAGAYSIPRHKCSTGYDNVFQINFISPYYLSKRLLPHICAKGGKVVALSSIAHRYSKSDASDVDFSGRKKASLVYGNAKRYLTYSLFELARREGYEKNIAIAHPGITFTNITAHYPKLVFAIIKHPMKLIFMKPRKACASVVEGLFLDTEPYEWIGPRLFDIWGKPSVKRLKSADKQESERMFLAAEQIHNCIDKENKK